MDVPEIRVKTEIDKKVGEIRAAIENAYGYTAI